MKKILSKILIFILGVVMAFCGLIVACAMNPDISNATNSFAKSLNLHIEIKKPETEEEIAAAAASLAAEVVADADLAQATNGVGTLTDVASTVSSVSFTENMEKEYSDYLGSWNSQGLDKGITNETPSSENPLVNEDINEVDENGNPVTYYDNIDEMTGYSLPEREDLTLADQTAVQEALLDASMGYQGKDESFDAEYYPYYAMLTDKCKSLYKQIYANAKNCKSVFIPVETATTSEWNNAFMSVGFDHPELFWFNTGKYTEYVYGNKVVKAQIYFYEFDNLDGAKASFDAATASIVEQANEYKKAEEKELYIHDYLAYKLTYQSGEMDQSAYSAIIDNQTVCAGYARAFQHLMNKLEIPTYFCAGWGGGLVSGGMHGWNVVKLGSKYVNVDVTWDDKGEIIYEFYNKPDNDFHRHVRMFNSQYLPECK